MSKWAVGRDGLPKGDGLPTVLGKRDGQPREAGASLSNYGVDSSRPRRDTRCVALHAVSNWDNVFDQTAEGGTDHIKMWRISTADYSQRPAKKQAVHDDAGKALQRAEGCNEFNIWYGKWIGEQWCDKGMTAAPSRCSVRRDAGRTKADDRLGMAAYCCVFFARGCCSNGSDCTFLHRIPSEDDEKRLALTHDIFGRERHNTNRDDMRGVGNFNSESRTLYIGGLKILHGATATFQTLLRQMSEWGEVEQLRLIPNKAIAFVRYKLRACAEFALESMHCQSLGLDELLNVRWAYDDPNPKVRAMIQENYHAQLVEACAAKGHHVSSVDFHLPTDYAIDQDPEAKRARREGGEGGNRVCAEYPNTDGQFCYSWSSSAETADSAAGATAGMRERVSGDFAPMSRAEVEALEEADRVREEREREQAKAREAERRLAAILDGVGKGVQEAGGKEGGGRSAEEQHDWREAFDQSTGRPVSSSLSLSLFPAPPPSLPLHLLLSLPPFLLPSLPPPLPPSSPPSLLPSHPLGQQCCQTQVA